MNKSHLILILLIISKETHSFYIKDNEAHQSGRNFRLSSPKLDYATIYNGVADPNNIAIHVMQNFVNFASGTFFW